jgi:catechol 2,3-dioxygenase-like lactoylglutathione lyase family enzyme
MRVSHIGICVSDPERSIAFHCGALGFTRRNELSVKGEPAATLLRLPDVELRAIYLERDGLVIELLHYVSPGCTGDGTPRALNALGFTHLSLAVDDLEEAVGRLEWGGATILRDTAIEHPELGAKAIFLTDPDGTLIELVEAT